MNIHDEHSAHHEKLPALTKLGNPKLKKYFATKETQYIGMRKNGAWCEK